LQSYLTEGGAGRLLVALLKRGPTQAAKVHAAQRVAILVVRLLDGLHTGQAVGAGFRQGAATPQTFPQKALDPGEPRLPLALQLDRLVQGPNGFRLIAQVEVAIPRPSQAMPSCGLRPIARWLSLTASPRRQRWGSSRHGPPGGTVETCQRLSQDFRHDEPFLTPG
jgi:hypothetical protein